MNAMDEGVQIGTKFYALGLGCLDMSDCWFLDSSGCSGDN
jgi:hypothetical protein